MTRFASRWIATAGWVAAVLVLLTGGLRGLRPSLQEGISSSQAVYDRDGHLLRLTLSSDQKYRLWLPLAQMAPEIIESTLLLEDRHFRSHLGVNPVSALRAAWQTYFSGGRRVGGSTLTMQLARIKYGMVSRSPRGKLAQMARSLWLELLYSKDEILEAYLNLVPYGGNIEGVGAASLIYFQKEPSRLTLGEALALAVIPQNPIKRGLTSGQAPPPLLQARAKLFSRWQETHPKDPKLAETEIRLGLQSHRASELPFLAPHFVQQLLSRNTGERQIRSTLNLKYQKLFERVASHYVASKKSRGLRNVSALLIDHSKMEVLASLGSVNYFDSSIQGQVDGTQAKRSPGSALKPFLYALAMDQGLIHPQSILKDAPSHFGAFDPENFDGKFVGPISAHDALIHSRNIPAVSLANQLKETTLHGLLRKAGVTRLRDEKFYGLSIALGGAEVTMEELATLFATLANGGILQPLRKRAQDPEPPGIKGQKLFTPEAAFLVSHILQDNPRSDQNFHSQWTRDQVPVAWKTGTSHGYRDAWAAGTFLNYTLVVWAGNFDGEGNPNLIGKEIAGPLLFQLVDAILTTPQPQMTPLPLVSATQLTRIRVCGISGELPGPHCKHQRSTWFIPGKSPILTCQVHRKIELAANSGLRACKATKGPIRTDVYEVWPSDLLKLFKLAGVPRRSPPAFEPKCGIGERTETGTAPFITSPRDGLVYAVRSTATQNNNLPLAATTDGEAREVFWFANERFLGKAKGGETLFWKPKPGRFVIRAVDDHGRASSRELRVSAAD